MIDIHYFGNINYFKNIIKNKNVILPTNLYYQKGWYNNKCVIIGSNGVIKLSIPIEGGRNQKQAIGDVKISYAENWRQQHKKTIFSCYGNSPFFEFYKYEFEDIFSQRFEKLFDFNLYITQKMLRLIKVDTICEPQLVDNLLSKNVSCSQQNLALSSYPILSIKYQQVFEDRNGFVENLSIIDLLFCCGTQAKQLLSAG